MPTWAIVALSSSCSTLVVLILVLGITSWAENTELDSGPRAIPYNGLLEFNGESFTGPADLRFVLTDDGSCNYTENHEDIQVFAGKFSVDLGTVDVNANPIPTCLFDADRVFLEMAVRGGNEDTDHIPLAGRQRITPVPFAYWAAEGSDFKIDGELLASGNATIGISNVRPPTNQARMELRHNVDPDGINAFNDFQLIMWRGNNAVDTFGQGIQGSTMFFNVPLNNQYNWYHNGTTRLFQLKNPTSTLDTSLDVNGAFSADSAAIGGAFSADAATISGALSAGSLTTAGALSAGSGNVTGTLTAGRLRGPYTPGFSNWNNLNMGNNAGIVNDNDAYKALMIVGNNSDGGARRVEVFDNMHVSGTLSAAAVQGGGQTLFNIPCAVFDSADRQISTANQVYAGANREFSGRRVDFYCQNGVITRIDFRN